MYAVLLDDKDKKQLIYQHVYFLICISHEIARITFHFFAAH